MPSFVSFHFSCNKYQLQITCIQEIRSSQYVTIVELFNNMASLVVLVMHATCTCLIITRRPSSAEFIERYW